MMDFLLKNASKFIMNKRFRLRDWFDPYNKEHMEAFVHLNETGNWPDNFLPVDIEILPNWQLVLIGKMADCWLEHYEDLI